jgi:hypothetical protein
MITYIHGREMGARLFLEVNSITSCLLPLASCIVKIMYQRSTKGIISHNNLILYIDQQ